MYTFVRSELGIPLIHGDGDYYPPTAGAAVITPDGESVLDSGEKFSKVRLPSRLLPIYPISENADVLAAGRAMLRAIEQPLEASSRRSTRA